MSKKQFVELAQAIACIKDTEERARVTELVGAVCAGANRGFDWYRWRKACNTN
jgi:uncharacterized membrane protein